MRHTFLLTFALLVVVAGCGRQSTTTTTPPKAKIMNCTLDICGEKKIQNPTEVDIRQAVFALDTKEGAAFLILGPTDMTYIQTSGDQKVGFDLEYQDSFTDTTLSATTGQVGFVLTTASPSAATRQFRDRAGAEFRFTAPRVGDGLCRSPLAGPLRASTRICKFPECAVILRHGSSFPWMDQLRRLRF